MTIYEKLDTLTAAEIRGNLEKFIFIYYGLKRLTTCYNKSGLFYEFNN